MSLKLTARMGGAGGGGGGLRQFQRQGLHMTPRVRREVDEEAFRQQIVLPKNYGSRRKRQKKGDD